MVRSILLAALAVAALGWTPALADSPPKGFEPHRFNGSTAPVTEGDVTTFHIEDKECSSVDFGDGRGESDCLNGSIRSMYGYSPWAQLGQALEYSFDLKMDPNLEYEGYYNLDAAGFEPQSWDSHLRLATWEGTFLHNFIYILKASKKNGVTFAGEVCQAPEDFGNWVSFSMKVKWTGDDKGWIAVTCGDRYIYVSEGAPSNVAPDCYVQNQCVPGEVRSPKKLLFIAGVQMAGWGYTWKETGHDSPFIPIQEGGITVQMRNLSVTSDPVLYGPEEKALVVKLQEALNGLGCEVGTADGVPGKRTREAALICRKFENGAMPAALNVATVGAFVDLYTRDGVADLPPGELPPEPLVIHMAQTGAETSGDDPQMVADLDGTVSGGTGKVKELSVLAIGDFNARRNAFEYFALLLKDKLGKNSEVDSCEGVRIEDWGQGGLHAVIEFQIVGSTYAALDFDCVTSKLPEETALEAEFIVTQFKEIAASMITDGTIAAVSHNGLRSLLERAAAGEVKVIRR